MKLPLNQQAWAVSAADFPAHGSWADRLAFVCRYGLLAPSVHNVQPWDFHLEGQRLTITIPAARRLTAGDPTGRELWLSLGACAETLVVAGRQFGLVGVVAALGVRDETVRIDWREETAAAPDPELLAAIGRRTTTRAPYRRQAIPAAALADIRTCYPHPDVQIVVSTKPALIERVADLTGHGIGLALSNPAFKRELSQLLRPSWTGRTDGFTPRPGPVASWLEAQRMRWLPVARRQAIHEAAVVRQSAGLVMVFSRGDTKSYWLEAGRAYQHCALVATRHGLATATTAAVVEAADYHLDIESACATSFRLQTVMRIGYAAPAGHSPRRPLTDVLAS
jgi:hypothetical protein